jgi:hypothetical protein
MADRDDFSEATKRFVALRASHQCSFPGCGQRTVGPSDESPIGITNIGEAAHICGAAPGRGRRRYVESMSPEERSHIDNAIWLCATHAKLIDRDSSIYTIDCLRQMKRDHEAACAQEVRRGPSQSTRAYDLIAIGPEIVCTGELLGINGSEWSVQVKNFVTGDFNTLIAFIEQFPRFPSGDQYILLNALGDGRVLTSAPTLTKTAVGYLIRCQVAPSFPRITAQELGKRWAISSTTNDLFIENGAIAWVSGLASLPQSIRSCLSIQRGECLFSPGFGVRFAEYLSAFRDSPWLGHVLMLDVIRQSSIPYDDEVLKRQYTPLQCIERVRSIEVLAAAPSNRLPVRGDFDVKGIGRWQCELSLFLPMNRIAG